MPLLSVFTSLLNRKSSTLGSCHGFTLIELSVVLTIIAVILGSSMAMLVASTQAAQYNATVNTMNTIEQALLNYAIAFNRLPCPSSLTITPTGTNNQYYGVEAANPGSSNCTGGTPSIPSTSLYQSTGNTYRAAEGGVPTAALNLPDSYLYDAWGHRIRYAVDTSLTAVNTNNSASTCGSSGAPCIGNGANNALPPPVNGYCGGGTTTGMTVYDSTSTARSSNAAYVLVSHGANGHGAYTMYGSGMLNAGSTNSAEQSNCHCSSTAGSNTYHAQYYQETPSAATASTPNTLFDDIVTYKESWQLRSGISSVSSSSNACTGSSSGLWVSDYANNRVVQLNSTGGYVTSIGTVGSSTVTDYQFSNPDAVAIDSSGNIWVLDAGGNRIVKYNASGVWQMTIGGQVGDICAGTASSTTCNNMTITGGTSTCCAPPSTTCSCTPGGNSTSSQLAYYADTSQIAFDPAGNLWTTDRNNTAVKEFNSSTGRYMNSFIPVSGKGPSGLAIDSGGNFWVFIPGQKTCNLYECPFSSTGNPPGTCSVAPGSNGCHGSLSQGSGKTTFNGSTTNNNAGSADSDYVYIDNSGNIWVNDETNGAIHEFNSSGTWIGDANLSVGGIGGPTGQYVDSSGNMWISTESCCGGTNDIYKINPSTGAVLYTITGANGTAFNTPQFGYGVYR